MSSFDKNLQQVEPPYHGSSSEACPTCGRSLNEHDRGTVDFYCPEAVEASNGN